MPSFHPRRFGLVGALGLAVAIMLLAGCNSSDSPTGPAPSVELSGPQAEDWTVQVLEMINGISVNVDDWAAGQFTGLDGLSSNKMAGEEPTFDEQTMAWTLHFEGSVSGIEAPSYINTSLDYYLQFRDGNGDPVASPELAASYLARLALGFDAHNVEGETVSDMAYVFGTEMHVAGLGGDIYTVDGSGSSAVEAATSGPEGSARMDFAMNWSMELSQPAAGGCPSGTAEVHATNFEMNAVYDGQGNADWTLTGPNYEASGTEPMECGAPMGAQ